MELDARHVRGDKLLEYYLSVSMLFGTSLRVLHPSAEQVSLLKQVAGFCKAELKGVGVGSEACIFTPIKLNKTYEADLGDESILSFVRTLIPVMLFSGYQMKLNITSTGTTTPSLYYIRDVLLPHLHRFIEDSHVGIQDNNFTMSLKGRYLLESAPLCVIRKQPELVALRGEIHTSDDSLYSFIELGLKDTKVPVRLHHSQTSPSFLHLNGLFGTQEGYDNDFAYIIFEEQQPLDTIAQAKGLLSRVKEKLLDPKLSQDLLEDLLLIISLVGGEIPGTYEETDLLIEEVQKLSLGIISVSNGSYVCRF